MQADITMTLQEEPTITMTYVEGKTKPEQTKDVTPSYEPQTVLPDSGSTLGRVNVAAIPEPTATETYTENGEYDVKRIGTAVVDVPIPPGYVLPEGEQVFTTDGVYDVTTLATAVVRTAPETGVVFGDFLPNGLPQTARIVGMSTVPAWFLYMNNNYNRTLLLSQINTLIIDDGITWSNDSSFRGLKNLKKVIFPASFTSIGVNSFLDDTAVEEYDFSRCNEVPILASAGSLAHAADCVLKIKTALMASWQNADKWKDLTGVIWQGV